MIEENGQGSGDQVFESHGVKLFVDPISIRYLKGAEVDFVDTITGGGFTIKNPNATSTCGCGPVLQRRSWRWRVGELVIHQLPLTNSPWPTRFPTSRACVPRAASAPPSAIAS